MKKLISFLFIILFISNKSVFAQNLSIPCLPNGNFAQVCANLDDCDNPFYLDPLTLQTTCVPNWTSSHGTPQILLGTTPDQNVAFMWYSQQNINCGSCGEGISARYSFQPNSTYTINVKVMGQGNLTGRFRIFAANGVPEHVKGDNSNIFYCGGAIPTNGIQSIQITETFENSGTWKQYPFYFKSSIAYSLLWIYRYSTGSSQYNLYVDEVSICPDCNGIIIYNSGAIPIPSGTTRAGIISAGSTAGTGGSGTVTINSSEATQLIAYNEVDLLPNLNITPTGAGSFEAYTENCPVSEQNLQANPRINVAVQTMF